MTFGNLAQQVGPTSTFGQAAPPVQPQNQGGSGLFGGQGASVFNSGGGNSGGGGGGGASSSGFGYLSLKYNKIFYFYNFLIEIIPKR